MDDKKKHKKRGRPLGSVDSRPRSKRSANKEETDEKFEHIERRLEEVEGQYKRLAAIAAEKDEIISFLKEENKYQKKLIEKVISIISNQRDCDNHNYGDDDLLKYLNPYVEEA